MVTTLGMTQLQFSYLYEGDLVTCVDDPMLEDTRKEKKFTAGKSYIVHKKGDYQVLVHNDDRKLVWVSYANFSV